MPKFNFFNDYRCNHAYLHRSYDRRSYDRRSYAHRARDVNIEHQD